LGAVRGAGEFRDIRDSLAARRFSWFGRNRCLTKDFETLVETLTLASIQLAIRRFARALVEVRKCMDSRPSPTAGPAAGLRRNRSFR
jgi:hypothetical protein